MGSLSGVDAFLLILANLWANNQCPLTNNSDYTTPHNCSLQDIISRKWDFIIVGCGSAGSVLANRLSEKRQCREWDFWDCRNWNVLSIEAGDYPSQLSEIPSMFLAVLKTDEDWQYQTEPNNKNCLGFIDRKCNYPRGKMVGGSSGVNAMVWCEGNNRDYDSWEKMGNPNWGSAYMKKYFKKLDAVESPTTGHMQKSNYIAQSPVRDMFLGAAADLGYQVNTANEGPLLNGTYESNLTIYKGERWNVAKGYVQSAKNRKNFCLLPNSEVNKIIFKESISGSLRATGVEIITEKGNITINATKEVIVSAGSIDSPKLLMRSGVGPKDHLQSVDIHPLKDLPVGRNLQDHVFLQFFAQLNSLQLQAYETSFINVYCQNQTGPLSELDISNILSFINTNNDSKYPNIELVPIALVKNDSFAAPVMLNRQNFNKVSVKSIINADKNSWLLIIGAILLNPKSRGEVRLKDEYHSTKPIIDIGILTDPKKEDLKTAREALKYVKKILGTPHFNNTNLLDFDIPNCKQTFDSDEYWDCYIENFSQTIFHAVGTCKMGKIDDPTSVVDPRLRVHGIKNLRVIDASIMPTIVSCNINIPVVAIAEKGADMIKEDHGF